MLSPFCFANLRKMVAIRKQVLCGTRYIELYKIKRALDKIKRALDFFGIFLERIGKSRRAAKKVLEPLRVPVGRT